MTILVAITSYGTENDEYLSRIIAEYRSMPFNMDIVALSNARKRVPPGVELLVGLPNRNPWSLPFAHKKLFAQRLRNYDLFIYSEDDILITERNIRAFLELSGDLPDDEIPGFLRFEIGPDGKRSYPEFHMNFRWDLKSVRLRNEHTLAFFSNEHSGCYMLTQLQLQRAIQSGRYLVSPHRGVYGLPETAATDPFTQCGFKKLINVSKPEDFLVRHLSDKYAGRYGIDEREFRTYMKALLSATDEEVPLALNTDSALFSRLFSKNYYEPVRHDLISLIPEQAKKVLSVGCGWGATEVWLSQTGRRVVVFALDPVMSQWAKYKCLDVLTGTWHSAQQRLARECFDCLVISNVLHLAPAPERLLSSLVALLPDESTVIAAVPSLHWVKVAWKRMHDNERCRFLGNFDKTKVHVTSHAIVRNWFSSAGIRVERFVDQVPRRLKRIDRWTLGLLRPCLASDMLVVGRKSRRHILQNATSARISSQRSPTGIAQAIET